MVIDLRAQMSKFLFGISDLVKTDCRNAMLLGDIDIYRYMTHAHQVEGETLREMAKDNKKARTGNYEYSHQRQGNRTFPTVPKYGKNNPSECFAGKEGCFGCGQFGHRMKDSHSDMQGQGGNKAQSTTSAAPPGHPTQQGASSSINGGQR
ncbi:uncharacterized protein LOC125821666 [Solanum verrucosum]|uniref:uncharacterized protein LOC125821666 n=1 Tax=Solanum verrucosum TaxID=315347 RepID=UPI0020D1B895|nr:uncharacterized protein LOC125821666 [Solanum verrucosum]